MRYPRIRTALGGRPPPAGVTRYFLVSVREIEVTPLFTESPALVCHDQLPQPRLSMSCSQRLPDLVSKADPPRRADAALVTSPWDPTRPRPHARQPSQRRCQVTAAAKATPRPPRLGPAAERRLQPRAAWAGSRSASCTACWLAQRHRPEALEELRRCPRVPQQQLVRQALQQVQHLRGCVCGGGGAAAGAELGLGPEAWERAVLRLAHTCSHRSGGRHMCGGRRAAGRHRGLLRAPLERWPGRQQAALAPPAGR
jgi:hypothetical protein